MLPKTDFSRNLGLITPQQQALLQESRVAICGVGGMGGIAAEALVRMGVGTILIADPDVYSYSDTNRQMHCTSDVVGQYKVDVLARKLRSINPSLELTTLHAVDDDNAHSIAFSSDVLINGMDCLRSSLLLERETKLVGRPIVNAWVTPYASVFVMTPDAPHWEAFLNLPTAGKSIEEITEADVLNCKRRVVEFTFAQFTPFGIVSKQLVEDVLVGHRPCPSLLPVVWLSGTLMANEAFKLITQQGRLATHWGVFYNHYDHDIKYFDAAHTNAR